MASGNDAELEKDRDRYLYGLQNWEREELASVIPFLFKVFGRIYDPAVFRNQTNYFKRSELQWEYFIAQTTTRKPRGVDKPSDSQNKWYLRDDFSFEKHGGRK